MVSHTFRGRRTVALALGLLLTLLAACIGPVEVAADSPGLLIGEVQGAGASSPWEGELVTLRGLVTGDFQQDFELRGFYIQDPEPDGDPATSDGIFVFEGATDVRQGDLVVVSGWVAEFRGQTELTDVTALTVTGTMPLPEPVRVSLPVEDAAAWERFEGMLVQFHGEDGHLTVVDNHHLGRGGLLTLAGDRLFQFTETNPPDAAGYREFLRSLGGRTILLDDGRRSQNPAFIPYSAGGAQLSGETTLRVGDRAGAVTGVLAYGSSGWDGTDGYRIHPLEPVEFQAANPRPPAPPPVGGDLRVGAFNLLNLFDGDGRGGGLEAGRGADDTLELQRQLDKLASAIVALDAHVLGLTELENDGGGALATLVDALNDRAGAGTYALLDAGVIGSDEITVGLIYRPAAVRPLGAHRVLNSSRQDATHDVAPGFRDELNRPALAQLFEEVVGGERLTVVVTHLKSKGSSCAFVGDPDRGDGQGECNGVRTAAARALGEWALDLAFEWGDPDVLIVGDLNAYSREDPLLALEEAGFVRLVGEGEYSFVSFGLSGLLDHALASPQLARQVAGASVWHINADEPAVLDYNTEFKSDRQLRTLYRPGPYRSSDHDPLLVGLDLGPPAEPESP